MKKTIVAAALAAGVSLGVAAPAQAVDWKPGTAFVSGQNTSHDWQAGYTYRWRSGRTSNGAYVTELARKSFRLSWVGPGDPVCDDRWHDRLVSGARFKTTVREASGAHNWFHGTITRGCPDDGYITYHRSYSHDESPNMYYMRTGAPPYIETHITMMVDDWGDPDWDHTNRMWWRGRQMNQPW